MLQNRVPPPQPIPSELVSIVLSTGPLAGPNPVGAVADYIDQLADLLPVTRTGVALIGEWLIGSEEQDYWKQELGRFPKTSAWIIANPQDPTAHNLGIEVDAIFHGIKWPSLVLPFTQITEWQLMTKYPRQGVVIIAPRQDAGVATLSHLFHREGIPVVVDENPTMTMTDGKQFTQNNQHFEGVIVAVGGK